MTYHNLWELILTALRQIAQELIYLTPKIFTALIVFVIAFVFIRAINIVLRKILKFAKLDRFFEALSGFSLPFSITSLLIFLADLGIALIALYVVLGLFLEAQYIHIVTGWLYYGARVISIVVITIFLFSIFGVVMNRIRFESRLRSYSLFIILLLVTAMLVDVTALSDQVKSALITGLSIGVGISVGIFAVWFFFHDYFDKLILSKAERREEES